MASVQIKHLMLLLIAPLSIAAVTGLAAGPRSIDVHVDASEPHDDHARPDPYNLPTLPEALTPIPSEGPAEYPLAVAFIPADPSNYTAGGIVSYDYIVVHTMQGYYPGSISWFQNPAANVSAHFCMQSDDGEITQMVNLSDRAWHVGNSNSVSIGIEHEGFIDDPAWYTWETYRSSAQLARWIADEYQIPLTREHIVAHSELPSQTHTDPGDNWDWDLYMALITDLVSEGELEGWVVDRSQTCTLTATGDTWIKKTLEPSGELSDTDKCFVAAGTQFEYLHASGELVGHRRLDYDPSDGPCAGFIDLDVQGYMFAEHFSATCEDASMGAAGVTVVLDGGAQVVTDATGYFSFAEVGPGAHSVDVLGGASYFDTLEPVDVDVHPGARVVIGVDPQAGPGDGDGDGDADGGECWVGGENCPCTDGGGCDPGLVCDPTHTCVPEGEGDAGGETNGGAGGGDDSVDYLEADSCSVTGEGGVGGVLGLLVFGLGGLALRRKIA
ncbi:N-acetylmuramoyl-L-alanine amidase [Enhygromyxa salina]|uniref:N-acetylmuramoyl-L-alanine amidase n=1 Tax=Enhygromyxa salina TaxID=215803 RepID=A0A2S9XTJ3_9BACT|nr:N-acetylmuramoyl-L-alanine amidase [Enhygromyxa salina]PRP96163.1 N-acetylmuramoyl-L-alanine amidase A [Enhygromyxa salina]